MNYVKAFFQATDALQADPEMATQMLYDWYTENGSETTLEACATEVETRPFVTSEEAKTVTIGESVEVTGEFWFPRACWKRASIRRSPPMWTTPS